MFTIEQKPVSKHQSRRGTVPIAIVDHISVGTMGSMYNTFFNPKAKEASSHFGVSRQGEIHQYVQLDRAAWTQGRIQAPISPLIQQRQGNPNLYCVSIEFEGYIDDGVRYGVDGDITEEQYHAGVWLHKFIQAEIERIYGHRIDLNNYFVLGHFQIDSIGKPFCPGPKFPWNCLYAELAKVDSMSMESFEEYLRYITTPNKRRVTAYAIAERVLDLEVTLDDPRWGNEAHRKIMLTAPVMETIMKGDATAKGICRRILGLYKTAQDPNSPHGDEAVRKLLLLEPVMKENHII
jgi:N-acetylmuramoyl-L-alanine amidase